MAASAAGVHVYSHCMSSRTAVVFGSVADTDKRYLVDDREDHTMETHGYDDMTRRIALVSAR